MIDGLEHLDRLRRLPFVRDLKYSSLDGGKLNIRTPSGRFHLAVEANRSLLTLPMSRHLIAWASHRGKEQGLILFARYIPRQAAEALVEAAVNFADDAGNIHLRLGDAYSWTTIGLRAASPVSEPRPTSPAQLQLLFQFVTTPESVNWPVRQLESAAGISKSKAALARLQMVKEGLLVRKKELYQLGPSTLLAARLTEGYSQILRPKLVLGRFRSLEKTTEAFLARLRRNTPSGIRYSLTGGPAAALLQHFYRSLELPLFVEPSTRSAAQQLRLLPDREGPITLLRAFGETVFGPKKGGHTLAPPWLIYAELLGTADPRAQEAAEEFRREFLP
jgi:hypothetical protein